MESHIDYHTAKALLEWQVEFGVTEAMLDAPVNRFEVKVEAAKKPVKAA
ncbi:MAG: uracil-DNA glycosylase, partial [Pseudomonadota bacterium]